MGDLIKKQQNPYFDSQAVDPNSFFADPDPDPAVHLNADLDLDPAVFYWGSGSRLTKCVTNYLMKSILELKKGCTKVKTMKLV